MVNELSTEIKETKLNIFQRIKLYLFNKQSFNIEKYAKAPDYIKKDETVIFKILTNPEYRTDDILSLIPEEKLHQLLDEQSYLLTYFSYDKQLDFIIQNPQLIPSYSKDLFSLVDYAVSNGKADFIPILDYQDQSKYLHYLKDNNQLENTLPIVLKYMDNTIIEKILSSKIELIHSLDDEQQISYAVKNTDIFHILDSNLQWQYIQNNPEFIVYTDDSVQEQFILQDINNLSKTSRKFQLETIQKHPNLYKYSDHTIQSEIFENIKDPACILASKSLLYKDIRNSKHLNISSISTRIYR